MSRTDASGREMIGLYPSQEEYQYWLRRAACLDPDALVYYEGPYDVDVPDGETWLALNIWNGTVGNGDTLYLRAIPREFPLVLTAGTRLKSNAVAGSYFMVVKPSLVAHLDKYKDPRSLYYQRLARLDSLPIRTSMINISAGIALGPGSVITKAFPVTCDKMLIVLTSLFDGAWLTLSTGASGSMNTNNEISDDERCRFADACMLPTTRVISPSFSVRPANASGTGNSIVGSATVAWVDLPEDW